MRFIPIKDLKTKLRDILMTIKDEEIIITSHGKPIAILSGVTEENLWKKVKAIRRSRAILALEEMQKRALELGLGKWTGSQIDSEIQAVRKARKRRQISGQ
jgi:prevent-host-death family protein